MSGEVFVIFFYDYTLQQLCSKIYLFTEYPNIFCTSSCSHPWKKVWQYISINQSPGELQLQYKRVLEDSDWSRSNNKGPHVSQVKRGVSLYAYICLHHLEVWKNSYFYYQLFRFLMPCIYMKTPCIYAIFYLKMWNTFKTHLWGSEQIKMASTKAEKLITLNHN